MNISIWYEHILKKLPFKFNNFVLRVVNWFFQGLLYASWIERIIKISIDLLLTAILTIFLYHFTTLDVSIILGFIIAHSCNWIFATNIWSPRIKNNNEIQHDFTDIIDFLAGLRKSVQQQNSIYGCAIFGSMSTGRFHAGSDVDVKLFRRPGFINIIHSYLFLFYIRTKANYHMIPTDIYIVDNINNYLLKEDETPIVLNDVENVLKDHYKKVKHFNYEEKTI